MEDKKFIPAKEHPAFSRTRAVTGKDNTKRTPANQLTHDVIQIIKAAGGAARRVNTTGTYIEGKTIEKGYGYEVKTRGKFIPSGMLPGFEDISAILPGGRYLAVEIKTGKDAQSKAQADRQAEVEAAGGVYLIVRTKEGFINDLKHRLN